MLGSLATVCAAKMMEALSELRARFELLTPRERAILVRVAEGRLNKQIAGELGITETTVKVHRSNMMRKIRKLHRYHNSAEWWIS